MRIPEYRGFVKSLCFRPQWINGSHIYDNSDPTAPRHLIRRFNEEHSSEVMPETLQQFTGCHDSRGNKVFEGDILHVQGEEGEFVVVWCEATRGFDTLRACTDQLSPDSGYVPFFQLMQNVGTDYHIVGNSVQIEDEVFPSEIPRRVKV